MTIGALYGNHPILQMASRCGGKRGMLSLELKLSVFLNNNNKKFVIHSVRKYI